jgi:hypothetical protein
MIGDPPEEIPSYQVNPIIVSVVIATLSAKRIGASGISRIKAPFPYTDSALSPYLLVAVTVATML